MGTDKNEEQLVKRCEQLYELARTLQAQNEELKKASPCGVCDKNEVFSYLKLYHDFLHRSQEQEWYISRKNNTKASQYYIDIEFAKYREFINAHFEREEQRNFKKFLLDMRLVDEDTFNSEKGVYAGSGKDRKRVLRVPVTVHKWLCENAGRAG